MPEWSKIFRNHEIDSERLEGGIPAFLLCRECGLFETASEARRKINEGGVYLSNLQATCIEGDLSIPGMCAEASILIHEYHSKWKVPKFDYRISTKDISEYWGGILLLHGNVGVLIKIVHYVFRHFPNRISENITWSDYNSTLWEY